MLMAIACDGASVPAIMRNMASSSRRVDDFSLAETRGSARIAG
jgi:hypothetical protein